MEKTIGSKEVKMDVNTESKASGEGSIQEELQKWSKERLIEQVIKMNQQLYSQDNYIKNLRKQLDDAQQFFANKRLEYLFKVIEIANKSNISEYACFAKDFVEECIAEIQESLTIPQQEEKEETPKEN